MGNNPANLYDPLGLVDVNFIPSYDSQYGAMKYTGSENGELTIGAHGNSSYILGPDGEKMYPKDLAKYLRDNYAEKLAKAKKIKIYSCNAGNGKDSFGESFAKEVGKDVEAPDGFVIGPKGFDELNAIFTKPDIYISSESPNESPIPPPRNGKFINFPGK